MELKIVGINVGSCCALQLEFIDTKFFMVILKSQVIEYLSYQIKYYLQVGITKPIA